MATRIAVPKYLILAVLFICCPFGAHGAPLLLGWGQPISSNTGIMDPAMAIRLGHLKTNVKQMLIDDGMLHPASLNFLDLDGRIWQPNFRRFDYDSNFLEIMEGMDFEPSALNAFFSSPVKYLVPKSQFMALLEDGTIYAWGYGIYNTFVPEPVSLFHLDPFVTQYPIVPVDETTFIHMNSQESGVVSVIDVHGTAFVFSSLGSCTRGNADSSSPYAIPLAIPLNSGNVTLINVRYNHGAAVTRKDDNAATMYHIWAWGQRKYLGIGYSTNLETCEFSPVLVTMANEVITHLTTTQNGTYYVVNNHTVFYFDHSPARLDQGFSSIATNGITIVKIVSSEYSVHFLYSNGEVWSRTSGRRSIYGATTLLSQYYDWLPDEGAGFYKADFGLALPSGFKIVDIEASASNSAIFAIAEPTSTAASSLVRQMLPPVSNPHPSTLVYWGLCPFWTAGILDFEGNYYDSSSMVFPTEIELRPLEPFAVASSEIKRWTSDGYHALILTSRHILTWGTSFRGRNSYGSYGPYAKRSYERTPRILDDYFYGGIISNVVDIASSNGTHMILLNNGSVILWGNQASFWNYDPFQNTRRSAPSLAAFDVIPGNYSKITGNLGGIGAVDTNSMLWTWGSLSPTSALTPISHSCLTGATIKFSVSGSSFIVVQQTLLDRAVYFGRVSNILFAPCNQSICTPPEYPGMTVCRVLEPVGFYPADIQEIYAFTGWNAAVTTDGVWIMGHAPFTPFYFASNWERIPVPAGLDWSSVKKVSFTTENMYWLLTNGTLISTAGDGVTLRIPPSSMSTFPTSTSQILSDFQVQDISTVVGDCQFAKVLRDSRPASQAPYLTRFFGSTECGQSGAGSTELQSAMESGKLLPPGHPLESDTISAYTVGPFGAIRDGNLTGSDIPRFMFWGGACSKNRRVPLYNTPGLLYEDDTSFLKDIAAIGSILRTKPTLVAVLKNCTFYTHAESTDAPTVFSDQDPDPSYPYSFRRWYPMDIISEFGSISMPACRDFHTNSGTSIIDMKCMNRFLEYSYGMCFVLASSRQHIFLALERTSPGPSIECASGFYGDETDCSINDLSEAVVTTTSLGPSVQISQFSIGQLHGLVLTTDGRLASWGSNHVGQLGIPTSGNSSRLQFISIPAAYSGSVTKIATSKWNSYAVIDGRLVLSWGSNKLGGLGRGNGLSFSSSPIPVLAPVRPIRDFTCAAATCYLLYHNGETYTWGMSGGEAGKLLGRDFAFQRFSSVPAPATMFTFPPPSRRVAQIMTSPNAYSIFVRGELYSGPIGPVDQCEGPPPAPNFECADGVWAIAGNVVVGGTNGTTQTLTLTGPTTVFGNLTVEPGSVIVVSNPSPSGSGKPVLNVTGCFKGDGNSFELTIDPKTYQTIQQLDGKQVYLAESSCDLGAEIVTLKSPKGCKKIRASTTSEQHQDARFGLNAVFTVDSKNCSTWWIVLISVFGAIILLVSAAGIAWYVHRKRKMTMPAPG